MVIDFKQQNSRSYNIQADQMCFNVFLSLIQFVTEQL